MRIKSSRRIEAGVLSPKDTNTTDRAAKELGGKLLSLNNQIDAKLGQLVERRVRASLQLIKRGEVSPTQALQAVVSRLAQELPAPRFASLLAYFQAKQTQGALAPAKQLLLHCLNAAQQGSAAPNPNPTSSRALQPLRKQQQPLRDQKQQPQLQAADQQANKVAGFPAFPLASSSFSNLTTVIGSKVAAAHPPDQAFNSNAAGRAGNSLKQLDAPATKQQQAAVLAYNSKAATWFNSNCLQLDV